MRGSWLRVRPLIVDFEHEFPHWTYLTKMLKLFNKCDSKIIYQPLDSGNLIGSISWPSTTDNGNNLTCRCLPINIEELHFCVTYVHPQDNHFVIRHIHIQVAWRPAQKNLIWIRLQRFESPSWRQKFHSEISIRKNKSQSLFAYYALP